MLVLDLTRLLPGPLAGRLLAEIGYTVLRLVPPAGDFMATVAPETYAWLHVGKQSETLDLKTEAGRERLRTLAAQATILLETNRPGVLEKLGVGPAALREINPQLTYVRLANYRDPAFHEAPGHDLACLAADGLLDRFEPAPQVMQIADGTAAFWMVIAAQEGVRRGGGFFEVYLAETARALAYPALPGIDGSRLCYSVYPAAEGRVVLAALEPHLWQRFCLALERAEWLPAAFSPTTGDNPIWLEVCSVFAGRSAATWETWAQAHAVPLRAVQPSRVPLSLLPWEEETEL